MTDNFEKRCVAVSTLVKVIDDVYLSNPILKHVTDDNILYHLIYDELYDRGYKGELIDEAWICWLDEYVG